MPDIRPHLLSPQYARGGAVQLRASSSPSRRQAICRRQRERTAEGESKPDFADIALLQRFQKSLKILQKNLAKNSEIELDPQAKQLKETLDQYFDQPKAAMSRQDYQDILDMADAYQKKNKKPSLETTYQFYAIQVQERLKDKRPIELINSATFRETIKDLRQNTQEKDGFSGRAELDKIKDITDEYIDFQTAKIAAIFSNIYVSDLDNNIDDLFDILKSKPCLKQIVDHINLDNICENDDLVKDINKVIKEQKDNSNRPSSPKRGRGLKRMFKNLSPSVKRFTPKKKRFKTSPEIPPEDMPKETSSLPKKGSRVARLAARFNGEATTETTKPVPKTPMKIKRETPFKQAQSSLKENAQHVLVAHKRARFDPQNRHYSPPTEEEREGYKRLKKEFANSVQSASVSFSDAQEALTTKQDTIIGGLMALQEKK